MHFLIDWTRQTNLSWIDWAIMVVAVVSLRLVSLATRHYMKGVTDFLSANRVAGRYLLTIAGQMGNFGVVTFIGMFEMYWSAGLAPTWWANMMIPVGTIILLTGWVYYRFRETRALTMMQFFEMRYSRSLRIFAGILCWTSGIINFGIFPAVAARFFIYFCGLPVDVPLGFHLPLIGDAIPTIAIVMAIDLILALSFVNMGGQISVMITECVQGMFSCFAFIVVSATILVKIHWSEMVQALSMAPANKSMLNPFHTSGITDFNIWYYLIGFAGAFYSYMSWQGGQGFFSSARTPHEQKMGGIIAMWRQIPHGLMTVLLALAAITVLKLPQFADTAHHVALSLKDIPNESVQSQMRIPLAMAYFLPVAVKGLLATIFLFFSFTCHDTYMHSWGSIFIQDIVNPIVDGSRDIARQIRVIAGLMIGVAIATPILTAFAWFLAARFSPEAARDILFYIPIAGLTWIGGSGAVIYGLKNSPMQPAQHIKLLRWAISGMALFAFLFSMYYKPTEKILFFFAITGTIWLGGSGAVIIGGLYWKKATAAAAYVALIVGAVLGMAGLSIPKIWEAANPGKTFPINGQVLWFIAMVIAVVLYVVVSLATWRKQGEFNLDRMLHRGKYRVEGDHVEETKVSRWSQVVGITSEFSRSDRVLAIAMLVWNAGWFLWFVGFNIANLFYPISDAAWARYFYINTILIPATLAIPATLWFTVGGIHDMKALFHTLATAVRDHTDDGRVRAPQDEFYDEPAPIPTSTD